MRQRTRPTKATGGNRFSAGTNARGQRASGENKRSFLPEGTAAQTRVTLYKFSPKGGQIL
jgi:hypothetical protein